MKSAASVPEESGNLDHLKEYSRLQCLEINLYSRFPFETNKAGRDRCSFWINMFLVFHRLNDRHQDNTKNSTVDISLKALFSFGSN